MPTEWVLYTEGDAVHAVQAFLGRLWIQAHLQAMFVPLRPAGVWELERSLVDDPARLAEVDPFAPVMARNTGCQVAELAAADPQRRLAAVLRPCEVRALEAVSARRGPMPDNLLTVGVDCLCTFAPDEYQRRARELGGPDELTNEALLFARQGGIAPYRYRAACQMCAQPIPEGADLTIGLLGLSAGQVMLVSAREARTADRLGLAGITDGEAPPASVARREQLRATLADRRARVRARTERALADVPLTVEALAEHLLACAPCADCLEACPVYNDELSDPKHDLRAWLEHCAGCGMCEQACPRGIPLAAIIGHIQRQLAESRHGGAAAETLRCYA